MDVETEAVRIHESIDDEIGDDLYAVGWYDSDRDPRTGVVYLSDRFKESLTEDTDAHSVLDNALLGRLGPTRHETLNEVVMASTTVYQTFIDVHVYLAEQKGVVLAIDKDSNISSTEIISVSQEVTTGAVGSTGQ